MTSDQILVTDLCQDALLFMERAVNGLSLDTQNRVMAGVAAGGEMEIRIRMKATHLPRISLVLVGTSGEIELRAAGGEANA